MCARRRVDMAQDDLLGAHALAEKDVEHLVSAASGRVGMDRDRQPCLVRKAKAIAGACRTDAKPRGCSFNPGEVWQEISVAMY
jgi:hypothetical protein